MTLDDESMLSAYLDGQLGPEEQQAVESAVCADPRLAEELRTLAALRELVAGLPRETPTDLSGRVMRRVRRSRRGRLAGAIAWGPARAAAIVGIAAGVLTLLVLPWLHHAGRGPAAERPSPVLAQSGIDAAAHPAISDRLWPRFAAQPSAAGSRPPAHRREDRDPRPGPQASPGSPGGDLVHVREYLDNPRLRRIFVVSDLEDESARRQVASIVEQTTRFNFYKFTISQGIVIDPRHPDQATVFALAVGPRELQDLRDGLRAALKGRVEETDVEPSVVAQLADIGQVEACQPAPGSPIAIPGDALALQAENPGAAGDSNDPVPPNPVRIGEHRDPPTPEQERSSPRFEVASGNRRKAADAGPGPGLPRPGHEAEEPVVVLVWVARSRPG